MTGKFTATIVLFLLAGCAGPRTAEYSPFGKWSSEDGLTLNVEESGVYEVCDQVGCETGKLTVIFQGSGAVLAGFYLRGPVQRYAAAHPTVDRSRPGDPAEDYMLAHGMFPESIRRRLCGRRHCSMLGGVDEYDPPLLFKISED